ELFARSAAAKGVDLVCVIDPTLPERLRGDPVRLRQVVTNLLGNAVKFTEHGEIGIRLTVASRSRTACALRIAVTDTGIGIPADRRAAIFESFTQADMSTTRRFGGTGLGLTITRHLVELMGGRIGVESGVGEGSTFWVELSLEIAAAPAEPTSVPATGRV